MGDPLHDVARFLSRFKAYAHGKIDATVSARAQDTFLSTYEILVPWPVERRGSLAGWRRCSSTARRSKSMKKLSTGGPEPVAAMLSAAAAIGWRWGAP
jgi:hypothetical protein